MRHSVVLTAGAERDLEELHDHIAESDSPAAADYVLTRLLKVADSLESHPDRGDFPPELLELGIREYRQVHFKPYRVIYRVIDARVVIYLIADGRRDIGELLARRLLAR